ncbi:hypothetical protein Fleli_2351 [Bernardetia litoralis DSM 6794]|uniref:Uncharacterized protein n=1 Tax=Bernardetia litoralis (strain ATCC 23117 / DSM 6794 / NBRC 15988 / NCIMB 1366 / Fx l1 / Sio-4) TaxID=880071 RepID=I4AL88_BERLS|nr:hypothetical protein [Bernardetia litoralis]AFM04723.1 hypothetical protein Fleli_2351 [Bernardetia litoralis DSM 6794]
MNINKKIISLRIWQGLTIMSSVYLLLISFMQYNMYPDNQTKMFNLIMGLVFTATIAARLLKTKDKVIPLLIMLELGLLTISSRAFLNNNFWNSIFSFGTLKIELILMLIFVADYLLRYFYFNYDKNESNQKS